MSYQPLSSHRDSLELQTTSSNQPEDTTVLPQPLPSQSQRPPDPEYASPQKLTPTLTARLYTSHALSTINSRIFEFGAVLFLAALYPTTLFPLSLYALLRSAAAIALTRLIGSWIDDHDRLIVVRASIVAQRLAVAGSCATFWLLALEKEELARWAEGGLFAFVAMLGCVERVGAVINMLAVERDWVVVIAGGEDEIRQVLNANMRRIDLLCKLAAPLAVSSVFAVSMLAAIWAVLGMNVVCVLVEYGCIAGVYNKVPALHRPFSGDATPRPSPEHQPQGDSTSHPLSRLKSTFLRYLPLSSLPFYFSHPAFLPSFSLALLYLTVLSFSGQMVTYLLSAGFTPLHVGLARTGSSVFEISATWAAPRLMRRIGPVRGGIWSLCWQMAWLGVAVGWFLREQGQATVYGKVTGAVGLAVGVALSRVGLWGLDLCAQSIVQDEVEFGQRGAFSAVETAFQNLFEMASYATTMAFPKPNQFYIPVIISTVAVYAAGGLYAMFVRKRRGHLFHAPHCVCPKEEHHDIQQ